MPIALPLMPIGYISELMSQVFAPRPIEKDDLNIVNKITINIGEDI